MSQQKPTFEHQNLQVPADIIKAILEPIEALGSSGAQEYRRQVVLLQDRYRQFRAIESFYAASYTRVLALEKKVENTQFEWVTAREP